MPAEKPRVTSGGAGPGDNIEKENTATVGFTFQRNGRLAFETKKVVLLKDPKENTLRKILARLIRGAGNLKFYTITYGKTKPITVLDGYCEELDTTIIKPNEHFNFALTNKEQGLDFNE